MMRRLLNLLTALSLLTCVALAAMWARSYLATDMLRIVGPAGSARVVFSRGEAVAGVRSEEWVSREVSFAFGTPVRPLDPDYVSDGSGLFGSPEANDPPGPGWKAIPFDSFTFLPLWAVTTVSAILPAWWLVTRVRRGGARPEGAVGRASRRRRLSRAAVATSTLMLALALVGWIDSATWHYQSWRVGRDRYVHLTSMWGECKLILMVNWLPPDENRSLYTTSWASAQESTLAWLRQPWLAPVPRAPHARTSETV